MSPKQQQAIRALLTCPTVREAAAQVGIGETTLYVWMGDPGFRSELRAAETLALEEVVRALTGAATEAVGTILTIMRNKRAPVSVRLRAAGMIIDGVITLKDTLDFEQRLSAVEDRQAAQAPYFIK